MRCKKAADNLAEEKAHILPVEENEDAEIFMAQIRVFLCTKYGYSANNSAELIEKHLQVSKAYNSSCLSGRS